MFQLGKTIVSEDIIEKEFVCNLASCKGACCIEGSAGAPLQQNEAELLAKDFDKISKYMSPRAKKVVKSNGPFVTLKSGQIETPLVESKACVYVIMNIMEHCPVQLKKHIPKMKSHLTNPSHVISIQLE